jgi:hypothetical protein
LYHAAGVYNLCHLAMTFDEFNSSLERATPPAGLPAVLLALWHDAHGDWDTAHRVAQDIENPEGAWVHAYLHRKEGDGSNAAYWYRRAGRPVERGPLQDEWDQIVTTLLQSGR